MVDAADGSNLVDGRQVLNVMGKTFLVELNDCNFLCQ